MTKHVSNAAHGVLDYVAYPIIMLAATPVLLHHLGVGKFGLWLIANAAISAGSIVSSGFGDAVIQRVAVLRSTGAGHLVGEVVANMLAINLVLSGGFATLLFVCVPFVTARVTHHDPALERACHWALRIGSALIVLKSIESVFISVQRAFESYATAVRISVATRISAIGLSAALAVAGYDLPVIMIATALVTGVGVIAQWHAVLRLGVIRMMPSFDRVIFRELASFGAFSWLQAISGILFTQVDRLLLALTLGASAVTYYGVCVQMAQPIHGLTAAGLHFIFPYLSSRHRGGDIAELRAPILYALVINVACSVVFSAALMVFGKTILEYWMGTAFVAQSSTMIPLLALGFGLLSLNITAHYSLLAMGRVRLVTALNIAGGVVMFIAMASLVPHRGVEGAAFARLAYGPITCLLYFPLYQVLSTRATRPVALTRVSDISEEHA
jgi:O-antigen/teichoic acid export membrane protein